MEFLVGVGGVLLFFTIYSYFLLRQRKKQSHAK